MSASSLEARVREPSHGPTARAAPPDPPGVVAALADDSAVVRVEAAAALTMLAR